METATDVFGISGRRIDPHESNLASDTAGFQLTETEVRLDKPDTQLVKAEDDRTLRSSRSKADSIQLEMYQYKPLESRWIRVLEIHVDTSIDVGDISAAMHCTLHEVPLDHFEDFDALSYTWGYASVDEQIDWQDQIFTSVHACYPIHVNGKIALITRSLLNALRRLRQALHPFNITVAADVNRQRSQFIWIDGLCIDQSNISERESQVSLMADIYSKAKLVHAYLGEHDESSLEGIAAGVKLANLCGDAFGRNFRKEKAMVLEGREGITAVLALPAWKAWIKFLCREWFFRTWVMQEIILASDEVTLTCGTTHLILTLWVNSLIFLTLSGWGKQLMVRLQYEPGMDRIKKRALRWLTMGHPLQAADQMRQRLRKFQRKLPIQMAVVYGFQHTQCTDQRDRVYGMLGSVAEFSAPGDPTFIVDYGESTTASEVYIRGIRHALRVSKSLAVLSLANSNPENKEGLPTWCHDFNPMKAYRELTDGSDPAIDIHRLAVPFNSKGGPKDYEQWAAAGQSLYHSEEGLENYNHLKLAGVIVDTIEATVDAHAAFGSVDKTADFFEFVIDSILSQPSLESASKIFDASWRTLVLDNSDPSTGEWTSSAPATVQDELRRLITMLLDMEICHQPQGARTSSDDMQRLRQVAETLIELVPEAVSVLPDLNFLEAQFAKHKQHFAEGKSMAIGSSNYQQGDITEWLLGEASTFTSMSDVIARRDASMAGFMSLTSHMMSYSVARQMARTSAGSIAYIPAKAQIGDQVCLLSGGPMAYVLRPAPAGNETWHFVGEAYVHGIMFGEAWPEDSDALRDFVLC